MRFALSTLAVAGLASVAYAANEPTRVGELSSQGAFDKLVDQVAVASDGQGNWFAVDVDNNKYWDITGDLKTKVGQKAVDVKAAPADDKRELVEEREIIHARAFTPARELHSRLFLCYNPSWRACSRRNPCRNGLLDLFCRKPFCVIDYYWSPHGPHWNYKRDEVDARTWGSGGGGHGGGGGGHGGGGGGGGGGHGGGGGGGGGCDSCGDYRPPHWHGYQQGRCRRW